VAVPADMCTCNLSLVFEGTSKHHPLMQIQESRRQLHTVEKRRVSRQRQWEVSGWQVFGGARGVPRRLGNFTMFRSP
jgi:hypothetical protein